MKKMKKKTRPKQRTFSERVNEIRESTTVSVKIAAALVAQTVFVTAWLMNSSGQSQTANANALEARKEIGDLKADITVHRDRNADALAGIHGELADHGIQMARIETKLDDVLKRK